MAGQAVPLMTVRYLDSDEAVAEYLTQVLADGDAQELLDVIAHLAKARGLVRATPDADLGRESFDTLLQVTQVLGMRLTAQPVPRSPDRHETAPSRELSPSRNFAGRLLHWLY